MEGKTISGYTLKHRLGIGGMAEVRYAENKIGKKAAVKMLLPKLCGDENVTSRFLTEAKIMVELNHPNIRQVYDYGDIDGRPTIVMEYLDGDDLKARMKKGERFSDEDLIMWWNQLVDALNYTHAKGIVHRDIKPGNIFVDNDGNIKLLDFGIAKVKESISSTQTGQKIGTLMYMSPEQVKDSKHIDYHTDIYSLAVTFVHLITGKRPYDSDTSSDFEISEQIVYHPLDLSELPDNWRGFLTPYLEKDPAKRPDLRYFEAVIPVETVEKPLKNIPTEPEPDDEETIVAGAEVKQEKKITEKKITDKGGIEGDKEEHKGEKPKKKSKAVLLISVVLIAVVVGIIVTIGGSGNNKEKMEEESYMQCNTVSDYRNYIENYGAKGKYYDAAKSYVDNFVTDSIAKEENAKAQAKAEADAKAKAEADAKAKKKAEESAKPKHEVQVVTTKTKNNVVYYGYDNPIIVSSNVDGALTVTAKGATVKDLRDNYYMLHVDSDAKEVVVSVSSKGALLGSKKLRLEELPLPEISITNEYNGRISKNAFLAGGRILPMLKHCLIEGVSYAIVSYSVRFKTASGSLKNLYVTGPKYTDELKEAINRAHPGDVFEFYDVKVKANDGREEIRTIKETKSVEIQ